MSKRNTPTIEIDMDAACEACGEYGASKSGLCLKCAAKVIGKTVNRRSRDTGNDITLMGKLKTIRTVPSSEKLDEVVFSLGFECIEITNTQANAMLDAGTVMLDAPATWTFEGVGNGFEASQSGSVLQKISAAATDDASLKVSFSIAGQCAIEGMYRSWEKFLPQIGSVMHLRGVARQQEMPL